MFGCLQTLTVGPGKNFFNMKPSMKLPNSENHKLPMLVRFTVGYPTYSTKETAEKRKDASGRIETNTPYLLLRTSKIEPVYNFGQVLPFNHTLYEVVNVHGAKLYLCLRSTLEEMLREEYIVPVKQESL